MDNVKRSVNIFVFFWVLISVCMAGGEALAADYMAPTVSKVPDVTVKVGEEASFIIWAASGRMFMNISGMWHLLNWKKGKKLRERLLRGLLYPRRKLQWIWTEDIIIVRSAMAFMT